MALTLEERRVRDLMCWHRTKDRRNAQRRGARKGPSGDDIRRNARVKKRQRYAKDPVFRIKHLMRNHVRRCLRAKSQSTMKYVGCSAEQLKKHLEGMFCGGMSWENHGSSGWHIDHVRPLASFDLRNPADVQKCNHFSNLQPLWASDNLRKGAMWTKP